MEENRNEEVLQDADETTAAQEQEPEITDEAVKEETAQAADADTAEETADYQMFTHRLRYRRSRHRVHQSRHSRQQAHLRRPKLRHRRAAVSKDPFRTIKNKTLIVSIILFNLFISSSSSYSFFKILVFIQKFLV